MSNKINAEDYIGKKFNKLIIIEISNPIIRKRNDIDRKKQTRELLTVICKCDCGNITNPKRLDYLKSGKTKSCGCIRQPKIKEPRILKERTANRKGKTRIQYSYTYNSFKCMRDRCNNPRNNRYHDYGGRGINVCDEWGRFDNFLRDMGERPQGYTLDRIDVNGNYEPSNCKWSTPKEQYYNKRNTPTN
jgi:hypothetical protein